MDTLAVTSSTVLKVLLASCIGSLASFALPGADQTIRDLNFLNASVFASCFSFANLVQSLTWDLVRSSGVIFFFVFITLGTAQCVGWTCAYLFCSDKWICEMELETYQAEQASPSAPLQSPAVSKCAQWFRRAVCELSPRDYQALYACLLGMQNTGTMPIALLQSMVGSVMWFDKAAFQQALSVIFVYTSMWTVFTWTVGLASVRWGAKRRALAEKAVAEKRRTIAAASGEADRAESVAQPTEVVVGAHDERHVASEVDLTMAIEVPFQHILDREAKITAEGGAVPLSNEGPALPNQKKKRMTPEEIAAVVSKFNPPLLSAVAGIVVALTPFLRYVTDHQPIRTVIGGIGLIGDGCVPVSLFTLGANLTAGGLGPLKKIDPKFVLVGTLAKTVLLPAINIAIYEGFVAQGWMVTDRVLRVTVWVELIAPSAIMCSTLCKMENYKAECATGLLLVQYTAAVVTTTLWMALFLSGEKVN